MSHPEDFCQKCGGPNPVWFADWISWELTYPNAIECIVCPLCFIRDYEAANEPRIWGIAPTGQPRREK